jgi:ribonuclease Z
MDNFKVTLLGTGTPRPKPDRYGSSTLVEAGEEKFIFDCGRCTFQRLFETGTVLKQVNKLFLTHLHSDHTVGIPDLWLTPWIYGRWEEPFYVWGPVGTLNMMAKLEEAFDFDIHIRPIHDLIPPEGAKIVPQEIEEGVVYEKNGVKVTAFEVDHRPIQPSYGYRVEYEGKAVVLSGDTAYCENLIKFAKNVDLLIHNVGAASEEVLRTSERYRSIMTLHASPEEAGEVFTRANPKLSVYTHMVLLKVTKEELVEQTRKTYNGPLEIGEDLMAFEIGEKITVIRPSDNSSRSARPDLSVEL